MAIQIDVPQKDSVTKVLVTDDGRTFVAASGSVESASDARNLYAAIVQEPSTLNPGAGSTSRASLRWSFLPRRPTGVLARAVFCRTPVAGRRRPTAETTLACG